MNHPAGGMGRLDGESEIAKKTDDKEGKKHGLPPSPPSGKMAERDGLPPPPPSVVGFAANDNKHPFEFTGDYVFQPARRDEKVVHSCRSNQETVPLCQEIFETILTRFQKNRGFLPNRIVVYRNGCSDGQFANVCFIL